MSAPMSPRHRPRVQSFDYRRFFWLVRREAAFNVLYGHYEGKDAQLAREMMCRWSTDRLQRVVARRIGLYPWRRYYDPPSRRAE